MKRLPSIAALVLAGGLRAHAAGWTHETSAELTTAGDFNGDGVRDVVIVDRASGQLRLGYSAAGTPAWTDPQAGGLTGVTAISAGPLLATNRDALAVAAPPANRVLIHDLSSTSGVPAPAVVHPPSLGPQCVLAIEAGGASNTPHQDLFIGTSANNPASPYELDLLRNQGGTNLFPLHTLPSVISKLVEANRTPLETGGADLVSALVHGATDMLRVYAVATGTSVFQFALSGLAPTSHFVCGFLNPATNLATYVTYREGGNTLTAHPVLQPTPTTFALGGSNVFALAYSMAAVHALEGTNLLAVVQSDRQVVHLYHFTGVAAPTWRQGLAAPAGAAWTGLIPLGTGGFVALTGDPLTGVSTSAQRYVLSGGVAAPDGGAQPLPALHAAGGRANVLVFSGEPFVTVAPRRLAALSAPAWSSNQSLGGTVQVYKERDRGPAAGLGARTAQNLGTAPAGATHLLANQPHAAISVLSVDPASGADPCLVYADPAGGRYGSAVRVQLLTIPAGQPVHYRLDGAGNWQIYSNALPLSRDATLVFYAYTGATARTELHSETYTFVAPPDDQDTDGDGVPDYVELGHGLDPAGGADIDGDGLSDFDELLLGTDPALADSDGDGVSDLVEYRGGSDPRNNASLPGGSATNLLPLVDKLAAFDLFATPRPFNGLTEAFSRAAIGTPFHAYGLAGDLLGFAPATNAALAGVTNPSVRFAGLPADARPPLVVVASPLHFAFYNNTNSAARELIGLQPAPALEPLAVPYTNAGGGVGLEASNWVAAATGAWATVVRSNVIADLTIYDTLAAVLFERKLGLIFAGRGVVTNADQLTLFPFRPGDVGLRAPAADQLAALATRSNGAPAYRLASGLTNLSHLIHQPTGNVSQLRSLLLEIYRLSSKSNDLAPGRYPPPVDELRAFIRTGRLNGDYTNLTALSTSQLAIAYAAATSLVASIVERPVTTLTLRVTSDLAPGACTTLRTTGGADWSLFDAGGRPYDLTKSFALVTGVEIAVTGFADVPAGACGGQGLEVESVDLTAIPVQTGEDADADLLPDAWERLIYGDLTAVGDTDSDGDGYMALQEYLEGTDPEDTNSVPTVAAVDLSLPLIAIARTSGTVTVSWKWPAAYQSAFDFTVDASTDLAGGAFVPSGVGISSLGDVMSQIVSPPVVTSRHFRVRMGLR